jgi:hypothetical protein
VQGSGTLRDWILSKAKTRSGYSASELEHLSRETFGTPSGPAGSGQQPPALNLMRRIRERVAADGPIHGPPRGP